METILQRDSESLQQLLSHIGIERIKFVKRIIIKSISEMIHFGYLSNRFSCKIFGSIVLRVRCLE